MKILCFVFAACAIIGMFITKGYAKYAKDRYIILVMGQATIPTLEGARIVDSIDNVKF